MRADVERFFSEATTSSVEQRAIRLLLQIESGAWHDVDPEQEHPDFETAAHDLIRAGLAFGRCLLTVSRPGSPEVVNLRLRVIGSWRYGGFLHAGVAVDLEQVGWVNENQYTTRLAFLPGHYTALRISEAGERLLQNARSGEIALFDDSPFATVLHWLRLLCSKGVNPEFYVESVEYLGFEKPGPSASAVAAAFSNVNIRPTLELPEEVVELLRTRNAGAPATADATDRKGKPRRRGPGAPPKRDVAADQELVAKWERYRDAKVGTKAQFCEDEGVSEAELDVARKTVRRRASQDRSF